MFNTTSDAFTMPVVPQGTNGFNDGFGGGWLWIIIILILFGGYGWGGYGNGAVAATTAGAMDNYVLNSDFSTLSRQIDSGFSNTNGLITNSADSIQRQITAVADGVCSLGYDQLGQFNNVANTVTGVGNAIQTQLADCCCKTQTAIGDVKYAIGTTGSDISRGVERGFADTNYNLAIQANGITTAISNGFCQTNYNAQTNTRDIVDATNASTQAILDKLCQMESNAKDEKIAELTAANSDLRLAASQATQNSYLISELRPSPIPSYTVANPYCNCGCSCGC